MKSHQTNLLLIGQDNRSMKPCHYDYFKFLWINYVIHHLNFEIFTTTNALGIKKHFRSLYIHLCAIKIKRIQEKVLCSKIVSLNNLETVAKRRQLLPCCHIKPWHTYRIRVQCATRLRKTSTHPMFPPLLTTLTNKWKVRK